jgi:hypothetical protein
MRSLGIDTVSWVLQQPENGFDQGRRTGGFGNYDPAAAGWTVTAVPAVQDERDTPFLQAQAQCAGVVITQSEVDDRR